MKHVLDLKSKDIITCSECGAIRQTKTKPPKKHKHVFSTDQNSGYFNLEDGKRVSHVQFCGCGETRTVDVSTGITNKGPRINIESAGATRLNS